MDKQQLRAFSLTKAMEFLDKPAPMNDNEHRVIEVANIFYNFLNFNEDKFGLKERARQETIENSAKNIVEIVNKINTSK